MGPIGPGFGGDGGGTPFYDLTGQKALPSAWTGKNTTYLLYLPVRNSLADASAAVGVPTGSYIAGTGAELPPAPGDTAPLLRGGKDQIVWYGTSVSHQSAVTRLSDPIRLFHKRSSNGDCCADPTGWGREPRWESLRRNHRPEAVPRGPQLWICRGEYDRRL